MIPLYRFSTNFYPEADEFVEYLHAFVNRTTPNVKFGREVLRIRDIGQGKIVNEYRHECDNV